MMNNNPYKIDYIKNTITASKKFLKAASVYGSTEYKTMILLRTDFPTFTFEEKQITQKKGKQSYKNLTFEKMREHIILCQASNSSKILFRLKMSVTMSKHPTFEGDYTFYAWNKIFI